MNYIDEALNRLKAFRAGETQFIDTASQVLKSVEPYIIENEKIFREKYLLDDILQPDFIVEFDVKWTDDKGTEHVNNCYRVQFNNALGPYKGGLRFHPSVNLSLFKSLAFEQIFKNSLTGLSLGGGKGGSDFDPKGKSDAEVKRFCEGFIDVLYKYIGVGKDVPAGDIGVGAREIKYMCDQYKKITGTLGGAFTGKKIEDGGSLVRTEATGYGLIYIVEEMLHDNGDDIKNKTVAISGSGNVAIFAAEKAEALGAKVITMSDSNGYIVDNDGIKLDIVKKIKLERRGRIKEYINDVKSAKYIDNKSPFNERCDIALPSATQNEVDENLAKILANNGCKLIAEGANMPLTFEVKNIIKDAKILYMPGKAANAGGVSVSGLEMIQNAENVHWTFEEVDSKLKNIMKNIFAKAKENAEKYGTANNKKDYQMGANIAGFKRVAEAMLAR